MQTVCKILMRMSSGRLEGAAMADVDDRIGSKNSHLVARQNRRLTDEDLTVGVANH